jgi:hypothetical protein
MIGKVGLNTLFIIIEFFRILSMTTRQRLFYCKESFLFHSKHLQTNDRDLVEQISALSIPTLTPFLSINFQLISWLFSACDIVDSVKTILQNVVIIYETL